MHLTVTNSGHTPAHDVVGLMNLTYTPPGKTEEGGIIRTPKQVSDWPARGRLNIVPVGETRTFYIYFFPKFAMGPFFERELVTEGFHSAILSIDGSVSYRDAFGEKHTIPYMTSLLEFALC